MISEMQPVNGKIMVRVNMAQKDELVIGGVKIKTANRYENNFREKSPVVAEVVKGNSRIKDGDVILCHHNHFYANNGRPSAYFLQDDLFSIPYNKTIFAIVKPDGELRPVCSNMLGTRVVKSAANIDIPIELREFYNDRMIITHGGWTDYTVGDLIFTRPYSTYEIVYNIDSIEHRVIKVSEDMVCGVEKFHYRNPKK